MHKRVFLLAAFSKAGLIFCASQFNPRMLATQCAIQRMDNIARIGRVLEILQKDPNVRPTLQAFCTAALAHSEPAYENKIYIPVSNSNATAIKTITERIGESELKQRVKGALFIMSRDLFDELRKL